MSISWKASLPISAAGTLPVIATIGTESSSAVPMPVTRFVAPGPGGAHAHADPAGHAGVAVGRVGAALLVADEDVAELGVVAEDVVERQDDAARVAEEDVDALAEERLADDVRADPGPLAVACLVEHPLAGPLDGRRAPAVPSFGHVAASSRAGVAGPAAVPGGVAASPLVIVIASSRLLESGRGRGPGYKRPSPPGEGPFGLRWFVCA